MRRAQSVAPQHCKQHVLSGQRGGSRLFSSLSVSPKEIVVPYQHLPQEDGIWFAVSAGFAGEFNPHLEILGVKQVLTSGFRKPAEWSDEQVLTAVLLWCTEKTGTSPFSLVSGPEIGLALNLGYDEIVRAAESLARRSYFSLHGPGPLISVTPAGYEHAAELRVVGGE